MRHGLRTAVLALALALGCAGCYRDLPALPGAPQEGSGFRPQAAALDGAGQAQLDAQLGLLAGEITAQERAAVEEVWAKLLPLREARLAAGTYEKSEYEQRLLRRLNGLYEAYTVRYLDGDEAGFGYQYPTEKTVAVYRIQPGGSLVPDRDYPLAQGWEEAELLELWDQMLELMPEGAFDGFTRLTLFTDGPDETMAYVYPLDAWGERWEIALDPADSGDGALFTETVLHEYFHYLSLNREQVTYTSRQTVDTYNEPGMVSRPGSYLDDFYQAFWTDYLDDCLVCEGDTWNFFLRHYDDFIDPYASTDPSEDISESFTFFVLRPRDPDADEEVWSRKLDFFYRYPELVEFRQSVRESLDLAEDEYYESDYYYEEDAAA